MITGLYKNQCGPSAALVSEVREAVDALGISDAAMSEVERQQVNEKLTTLFGKDAALMQLLRKDVKSIAAHQQPFELCKYCAQYG